MESQVNSGYGGTQGVGGQGKDVRAAAASPSPMGQLPGYVLRFAAFVLTLIAAIVMGVDKQTTTISVEVAPTLPSIDITATAKSTYSSAFVYFIVANAISCVYSALSLAMSMMNKGGRRNLTLLIFAADLAIMALLFSSNGAAAAIGVVGEKGNSHVGWNKICNVFGKFCASVIASGVISLLGSLTYFVIILLTVVSLHRRSA